MTSLSADDVFNKLRFLLYVISALFGMMHFGAIAAYFQERAQKKKILRQIMKKRFGFQKNGARAGRERFWSSGEVGAARGPFCFLSSQAGRHCSRHVLRCGLALLFTRGTPVPNRSYPLLPEQTLVPTARCGRGSCGRSHWRTRWAPYEDLP